jgi:hypothetical protein
MRGSGQVSGILLTSTGWCILGFYHLDRVLLATCMCKCCVMQLGGSGMTSGEDSGFCITVTHQATHLVLQFLIKKNNPVIVPHSLNFAPSYFWLFPTLKMSLNGAHFTTMEDVKLNATAEFQEIPKETFRWCGTVGSVEQMCVHAMIVLWKWLGKRCHMPCHCPSYIMFIDPRFS